MSRRSQGAIRGQGPRKWCMLNSSPLPGVSGGIPRVTCRGDRTKGSFVNISRAMAKDSHTGPEQGLEGLHREIPFSTPRALTSTVGGIGIR